MWGANNWCSKKGGSRLNTEFIIQSVAEKLELPTYLVDEALNIYNDNLNLYKKMEKKAKNQLKLASLFMACRINNIPRTLQDFSMAGDTYKRDLFKRYNKLLCTGKYKVPVQEPIIYLSRIASRLNIDAKTIKWAEDVLTKKSEICSLVGSSPILRAGTVLYISCIKNGNKQCITQEDIAEACGGTSVAIMVQSKKLRKAGVGC